jgi:hypothetical protein
MSMAAFVPKVEAYGVYKGPLYTELHDEEAELCRYSGGWLAARFLTEGVTIRPTGEDFHVDPSTCWLLVNEDDFDIVRGEIGPCDWCSSFDFRCTNLCRNRLTTDARRDGSIIMPATDPLRELARLIGQGDPFGYQHRPPDNPREGRGVVTELERDIVASLTAEFHSGGFVGQRDRADEIPVTLRGAYPPIPKPYQYNTRLVVGIAVCWFITGIILGWWGTSTWPWW